MNKIANTAREGFNIWKMAILKVCLVAFITGVTTLQTSLNGLEWGVLSGTQKVMLICGVMVAMATTIVAFLDRTMSRIEDEQKDLQDSQLTPVTPATIEIKP